MHGRAAEVDRIARFLDLVVTGARGFALRGEPGIGKTTLWRHALSTWRARGGRVLSARPAQEEAALSMSTLLDLLPAAGLHPRMADPDGDPLVAGRAVHAALAEELRRGPVLLAVDDVQWLDAASARAMRYALRRLEDRPLGVLTTIRTTPAVPDPLDLPSQWSPDRVDAIDLGPLGLDETRRIVGQVVSAISPRLLRRIHDVSGGNPLFALELARGLPQGSPGGPAGQDVGLPRSLSHAVGARLENVPDTVLPLLHVVSALGRTTVAQVREFLPEQEIEPLVLAADRLGILTVGPDLELRFSHPMVGSVVYERMHPLTRTALHARLAAHTSDPDLRARHLGLSAERPDGDVADALAAAAERAAARGAGAAAAELGEMAVRLTPDGRGDAGHRYRLALVRYLVAAGEMARALDVADRLIAGLPPGATRARAHVLRAQLESDDTEAGEAHLMQALADAADDAELRGQVLDQLGWLRGVFRGDLAAGIECAREALAIARGGDDPEFEMSAAAGLSNLETLAGHPRPDLMARAVEIEDAVGRPPMWSGPRVLLAEQLLWQGDLTTARTLLQEAVAEADRRRHERWRPYSLYDLAAVEGAAGNLVLADELLHKAVESARDCEDAHVESWIFYRLALVATWLGRAEDARSAARRRLDAALRHGQRPGVARARSVLGLLALSEGDPATAATELVAAVEALTQMGLRHAGAVPAVPDAIEALTLAGDVDAAERLLVDTLRPQAAAVGSRWVDAAVVRAAGTVALGRGEPAAADLLDEAAAAFECLGFRPDAARASLLRGRALVRLGRRTAAADCLAGARDAFAAMSATLWLQQAVDELERVAPGRSTGALTATERRVAALVASGRKNKDVARELFVSVATVEAHLTRIFRKLGIASRSELVALVATGAVAIDGDDAPRRG